MTASVSAGFQLTAVLFDLYGTLVDIRLDQGSDRVWVALAAMLSSHGAEIAAKELKRRFHEILDDERSHLPDGFVLR
ncbi:MAG: hypothetical protein ACRD4Y_17175, partial [Candidatus Acidiferrales bacterium]